MKREGRKEGKTQAEWPARVAVSIERFVLG